MIRKKNVFFLILLSIVGILFYLSIEIDNIEFADEIPRTATFFNDIKNQNDSVTDMCYPFLQISSQYIVLINGIKYPRSVPLYLNKSIDFECLKRNKHVYKILFWTKPSWLNDANLGISKPFIDQNCPVTNCEITSDIKKLYQSELVITHMRDKIRKFPKYRHANQRWLFMLYESPVHSDFYGKYNGFYNMTSTYKIDSDFSDFYESTSSFEWKFNDNFNEGYNFIQNKFGFAAAVISNCYDNSQRLEFINELQKYIPVTIFGKCGKSPCPTHFKNGTKAECKQIIGLEYLFYFAFENSICKDYITEKFFEILPYPIIPVVLGKSIFI
jgi:hypothetical protein